MSNVGLCNSVEEIKGTLNLSVIAICGNKDKSNVEEFIKNLPDGCELILVFNEQGEVDKTEKLKTTQYNNIRIHQYLHTYKEFRFDVLRNESLKYANRKWILRLDIDERIQFIKSEFDDINNYPDEVGGVMTIVTSMKAAKGHKPMIETFHQLRIFRNKKEFYFTKRIHENNIDQIIKAGYKIVYTSINIKHIGYEDYSPEIMIPKHVRNIVLSAKELAENPHDKLIWYQLKDSLTILNDFGWFKDVVIN